MYLTRYTYNCNKSCLLLSNLFVLNLNSRCIQKFFQTLIKAIYIEAYNYCNKNNRNKSSLLSTFIYIICNLLSAVFKFSISSSRLMHSSHNFQKSMVFRIENNILIGEEVPIYREYTNVGALVLEKMRSRSKLVAQVSRHSRFRRCRQRHHRIDFNINVTMIRHLTLTRSIVIPQVEAVTGTETTFAEMTEKSVKCALWLGEQAVQLDDIIGICTHNHLESYIPLLAALYVGAISNPQDNELFPSTYVTFLPLFQLVPVFFRVEH